MDKFDWKVTIKSNIIALKFIGLWPKGDETYKFNLYTLYAIISIILFIDASLLSQILHIFFVHSDLEELTETIFVSLTELLGAVKIYYFVLNVKLLKQLMINLNNDRFQIKTVNQIDQIRPALVFWKITHVAFWVFVTATIFLWSILPLLDNSFKQYELPFAAWYPYHTNMSPFYEITYLHQVIAIFLVAIAALNIDTLMAALMMYIGAQCDILCDNLRNLKNDHNSTMGFNKKLIDCIKHHKEILAFAENSNKFFDMIVFGQFFTSSVSIGLAMFQLSLVAPLSSGSFSLLSYVSAVTVQIFLYCWFGNEVEMKTFCIIYEYVVTLINFNKKVKFQIKW